ncbi:MAG: serine protease [bacterium]|nr:serine protease [bacterium]
MNFLKRHAIPLAIFFLAGVVIIIAYQSGQSARKTESMLTALSDSFEERFLLLDKALDEKERQIVSLKESGFIEAEDFSLYAETVKRATVMIVDEGEVKGSGFFIDSRGIIATAAHVADAVGGSFDVQTVDGRVLEARVLAKDSVSDTALVGVDGKNFPAVSLGYFENIEIGEEIGIAAFNRGLSRILIHRGVISAKDESGGVRQLSINAFVNKGNSGGPIFSAITGRVIGMVSSRQTDIPVEKLITLPAGYSSGFAIGGIDPVKFNVDLYNETVKLVGDVSQVGIGFGIASEHIRELQQKIK